LVPVVQRTKAPCARHAYMTAHHNTNRFILRQWQRVQLIRRQRRHFHGEFIDVLVVLLAPSRGHDSHDNQGEEAACCEDQDHD